jgi:hypothetical protein
MEDGPDSTSHRGARGALLAAALLAAWAVLEALLRSRP